MITMWNQADFLVNQDHTARAAHMLGQQPQNMLVAVGFEPLTTATSCEASEISRAS